MTLSPDQAFICSQLGVVPSAQNDVDLLFEEQGGDAPFSKWLDEQRASRPHWFAPQADASLEILHSVKAQGDHVRQHGEAATRALLKANGLTLGQIKPRPKEDGSALKGVTNPYSDAWRGTPEQRQIKIASLIRAMGTRKVAEIAAAAGRRIDGSPLTKR
ncbi:hypothetical protein ACVSQB_33005 [Bradyrhizobium elkanii]